MEFRFDSVVRGYHVYESVWNAIVEENLPCIAEPINTADRYADIPEDNTATIFHV